jgi:hypothetical protein
MKASRVPRSPVLEGWVCLAVALAAMFGMVLFVVAAADDVRLVLPAVGCLFVAAYACTRLFCRLYYGR